MFILDFFGHLFLIFQCIGLGYILGLFLLLLMPLFDPEKEVSIRETYWVPLLRYKENLISFAANIAPRNFSFGTAKRIPKTQAKAGV